MFEGIFNLLLLIVGVIVGHITDIIQEVVNIITGNAMDDMNINLLIFSETPIFSTNLYELMVIIFTIFFTVFFIVLLYKVTKNIIKKVFGVFKL